jgi:2-C-methyl-D-erythritol 4-phosphate cytidylyltransferase
MTEVGLILLAGGRGQRMGEGGDKLLRSLRGRAVADYSFSLFGHRPEIAATVVVHRDADQRAALEALPGLARLAAQGPITWARGGGRRQDSVRAGLAALPRAVTRVAMHDLARPLLSHRALDALFAAARDADVLSLAHPVTDTIKRLPSGAMSTQAAAWEDLERPRLRAVETPQVFPRDLLTSALDHLEAQEREVTDDLAAVAMLGYPARLVDNPDANPKLTVPEDIPILEAILARREADRHSS